MLENFEENAKRFGSVLAEWCWKNKITKIPFPINTEVEKALRKRWEELIKENEHER